MAEEKGTNWCEPAPAGQRAEWAELLAKAYVDGFTPDEDQADVADILLQISADPAASVRRALAETVAASDNAPKTLIRQLLGDSDSVSAPIIRHSPLLSDHDLIEAISTGRGRLIDAVLARETIPGPVCAAIVADGDPDRILALVAHSSALLTAPALRQVAETFGDVAEIRGAMFDRADLPATLRQMLVRRASEAVAASPLAQMALGAKQSQRVGEEACQRGTVAIVSEARRDALSTLVDDLVAADQMSSGILLRLACSGSLEGLAEALARLANVAPKRVRSILVDGRKKPFVSICDRAGLPSSAIPVLFHAVDVWREADENGEFIGQSEVAARIMSRMVGALQESGDQAMEPALAFLRGLAREMSYPSRASGSGTAIAVA